jgi:xanthine dehydrogenase accessory factor
MTITADSTRPYELAGRQSWPAPASATILTRAGPGRDDARRARDPAAGQHPAAIAVPQSADDTAAGLEQAAAGQDWQDLALQLRHLLSRGTSLAIATVLAAHGTVVRRPGTVLVLTQAGQTIGFNPAGPLDGAIADLAAEALATGQDRLECLQIEPDAAAYIGLSGEIRLDVHAMRMDAADSASAAMLRYLDSGAAAVLIIGTRGAAGAAVIGADHVAGQPGRPALPPAAIQDARSLLGRRHTAPRTYGPGGEKDGTGIRVWMASYPQA